MKPSSKLTSFLVIAGLFAAMLAVSTPPGRKVRDAILAPLAQAWSSLPMSRSATDPAGSGTVRDSGQEASATAAELVKIPAIRGENHYGWVQLPRGTTVDLLRRTPDSLMVRWDGTVVQVPPSAVLSGAIALRTPATSSDFRN